MFHKARIKLTIWYLLIIMVISISFSIAINSVLTSELDRVERTQRYRIEHGIIPKRILIIPPNDNDIPRSLILDPEIIEETKNRIKLILIVINFFILGASSASGYFLAGRTLKPIKEMVDEQKRFVADASHELRTPLTAIKTEIEVALRDKKINLNDAKKLLKSNLEEIDKLKALTDYFLTLSKYQNSDVKLILEEVNIKVAVEESINKLQIIAKEKLITIEKDLKDIKVIGNKTSIIELVTILLDNAVKYSHKNGIVKIKTIVQKNQLFLTIEDFGIGIKSVDIPHIFDRFYRADLSRTKYSINGYGLGLAIAKSIVDLHHGQISVDSSIGKGSIFTVSLPVKYSALL